MYGVITFLLEHPAEVEAYLIDQQRILDELKAEYPMPAEMVEQFEQAKRERVTKPF